jgi:hypothetical protein
MQSLVSHKLRIDRDKPCSMNHQGLLQEMEMMGCKTHCPEIWHLRNWENSRSRKATTTFPHPSSLEQAIRPKTGTLKSSSSLSPKTFMWQVPILYLQERCPYLRRHRNTRKNLNKQCLLNRSPPFITVENSPVFPLITLLHNYWWK